MVSSTQSRPTKPISLVSSLSYFTPRSLRLRGFLRAVSLLCQRCTNMLGNDTQLHSFFAIVDVIAPVLQKLCCWKPLLPTISLFRDRACL